MFSSRHEKGKTTADFTVAGAPDYAVAVTVAVYADAQTN